MVIHSLPPLSVHFSFSPLLSPFSPFFFPTLLLLCLSLIPYPPVSHLFFSLLPLVLPYPLSSSLFPSPFLPYPSPPFPFPLFLFFCLSHFFTPFFFFFTFPLLSPSLLPTFPFPSLSSNHHSHRIQRRSCHVLPLIKHTGAEIC